MESRLFHTLVFLSKVLAGKLTDGVKVAVVMSNYRNADREAEHLRRSLRTNGIELFVITVETKYHAMLGYRIGMVFYEVGVKLLSEWWNVAVAPRLTPECPKPIQLPAFMYVGSEETGVPASDRG